MSKFSKFLASILSAVCIFGSMATLAACKDDTPSVTPPGQEQTCGDDSSQENTQVYKIKVLYPDGTPVVGVDVQVCKEEDCKFPVATDENGVAVLESRGVAFAEAEYEIHIIEDTLPAGYTFDNSKYKTPVTYAEVTVYLEAVAQ